MALPKTADIHYNLYLQITIEFVYIFLYSNTIKANSSIQWSASKAEDRTQLKAADVANGTTVNYSLNASPSNPTSKTGAWWLEGLEYSDTITLTNAAFASGANSAIEKAVENMLQNSGYKYDSVSVTVNGSKADISFKVYSRNTTAEMTAPSLTLPLPVNNNTIVLQEGNNAVLNNSLSVKGKPINKNDFSYEIGGNDVSLNIEAPQGPKFSISKTVDGNGQLLYSGSTDTKITYIITVNNYGDTPGDITVEDLPKTTGLTLNGDSTYTFKDVKPGEPQSITIECSLDETALDYIGNIASVCNRAQDKDDNTNYSDAYITVEKATSSLNAYKSGYVEGADNSRKQTFAPGDTVTYTINISNNGKADAENVLFEDTIDSNLTDIEVTPDTLTVSGNNVSGTIDKIAANGSATITITGKVVANPSGDTIYNVAQVDGKNTNEVVFAKDKPSLSPSKDGYVGTKGNYSYIGDGTDTAVYTIIIYNSGEVDAEGVQVEDTLPDGFVASSYQIGNGDEVEFTGTKLETTVDVPGKGSVTITIKGSIKEGTTGSISNTANITYNGETKGTGTVYFNEAKGNIGMYKTVDPSSFIEGTETDTTWKIYVSNNGDAPAENVKITDTVPANASFESYSIESNKENSTNIKNNVPLSEDLDLTLNLAAGENITIIIKGKVSGTEDVINKASFNWGEQGYDSSATSNVKEDPNKYVTEKWTVDETGNTLVDKDGKTQNGFEGYVVGDTIIYRAKFTNNSGSVVDSLYFSDYSTGQNLIEEDLKVLDENGKLIQSIPYVEEKRYNITDEDFAKGWYSDYTGGEKYPRFYCKLSNLNLENGKSIILEYRETLKDKKPYGAAFGNDPGDPANAVRFIFEYKEPDANKSDSCYVFIPVNSSFSTQKSAITNSFDISSSTLEDLKKQVFDYTITLKPDQDDKTDYTNHVFTLTDKLPDGMEYVDGSVTIENGELSGNVVVNGNEIIIPVKSNIQPSGWSNQNININYKTKLTSEKAKALYETGEKLTTLTNTVTNVVVTKDDETVKESKPNASADIAFKKVNPAPGFAKIAHASFAGTVYDEELLQPVEDGFITAGDTLIWRTVVYNGNGDTSMYNADNTAMLKGYTVTDTLPDLYSYDAEHITGYLCKIMICNIGADGKPDDTKIIKTLDYVEPTANGKNYTWDFSDEKYALAPNQCIVIEFDTIADVDVEGVITNTGYAKIDQPFTVQDTVAGEKKDDTIHSYANYNIAGLTTKSWKTIHYENEGHLIATGGLHDDPDTDTGEGRNPLHNYVKGMQGEKVTYTINVRNNSPLELENMSIIDRLPYEGDMGLVSGYERNSAFGVKIGKISSVKIADKDNSNVRDITGSTTVTYSNNKTAVLNEHSKDWIGQDDAMNWSTSCSDDSVNFRVIIDSSILIKPKDVVTIEFTGYVPEYVANTGEENIAWNSFAYSYQNSAVLPGTVMVAEPAKVGVWVETPNATNSIKIDKTIEGTTGGTYYFALFDNKNNRVSDVVSMVLDADATEGTISMDNLDFKQINNGNAVFIWETDAKGNILGEQVTSPYDITYSTNEIDTSKNSQTIKVTNKLNVGDITVTKNMIANTAKKDTFYFALFTKDNDDNFVRYEDAAVQSLTLSAKLNADETAYENSGAVTFKVIPEGIKFYVLETNENGVLTNTKLTDYTSVNGNSYTTDQGSATVQAGDSTTITNTENAVYSITVTKVLSSDDIKTTPKFSVGLFTKNGDSYTQVGDTKTVVSGGEVKFDNLDADTTYYVFELDADGKRLNAGDSMKMPVALSTDSDKTTDKNFVVSYEGCGNTAIQFANATDSSKNVVITNTDTTEDLNKLTVTKSVMDENGLMSEYTGKFYVGLYIYEVDKETGKETYEFVKSNELSVENGTGSVEFTDLSMDNVYVVYELASKTATDSPYMEGAVISSDDDNFVVSYPGGTQVILEPGVPGTLRVTNTKVEEPVLSFIKSDVNGEPYVGAHMTLTNGTFTEEWDTTAEPYTIKDLTDGKYTLTETPIDGYASLSVDVVIKDSYFDTAVMDDDSYAVNSTSLTVFNRSVLNVSKVDINDESKELAGAKIKIELNDADTFLSGVEVSRGGTELNRVPEFSDGNAENGYNEYILEDKTLVFFSDGENDTVITGLPDGSYTMTEEIAPDGYTIAESYNFIIKDGKVSSTQATDSYETVNNKITMKDSIEKSISISKQDITDSSELSSATLSIIFEGTDDLDASSIKMTRANAQGNSETFEDYTIEGKTITFTSGNAPTKIYGLPNGSYTLHEEAAPNGYQVVTDFTFEIKDGSIITEQPTDREDITVNDAELIIKDSASEIKISKRDVTGNVEIKGATLKLTVKELANDGVIDWAKISENTALEVEAVNEGAENSQNGIQWTSDTDMQIIKYLPDGTYVLKETGTEFEFEGITYAVLETSAEFTIKDGKILTNVEGMIDGMDSDYPGEGAETGAYVYDNGTIVVCDAQAKAKSVSINISKKDIGGEEVSGASLRVYFIDEEGTEHSVDTWTSGKEAHVIEGLTPNKTYILEEVGAPDGYAYAESIEFSIDEKGKVTASKEGAVDENDTLIMTDEAIADIVISKQDITSKEEIKDAKLELHEISEDTEGNETSKIVESWTSGEYGENEDGTLKSHTISGDSLKVDTKYKLVETGAPNGYAYAESIEFTIDKNGNVVIDEKYLSENGEIVMSDAVIEEIKISKRDITGQEKVEGATLQILDEENNVIEEWTSDTDDHLVDVTKLSSGKTYKLHEEGAPDGYIYAADIEFTVNNDGTVTVDKKYVDENGTIIMKDDVTKVVISKIDATTGNEIEGAELKLYQITDKDGNALDKELLVDEWTSGDDGKNEDGTIKSHTINGKLIAGAEYRLVEITAPDGYQMAEDVTFTVNTDGSVNKVEMKDAPKGVIAISKLEINGTEELEGATLQILDENGNVVEEWVSGSDKVTITDENGDTIEKVVPHSVKLDEGNYTLKEITAPDGYLVAEEINFNVSKDGKATVNGEEKGTIVMKDDYTKVNISKKDITGDKEIPGASLELRDSDGNLIDKWISDGTPHEINKLTPGEYTLHEEGAPDGYAYSEDVTFEVTETSEIQTVTMKDNALEVTLSKKALTGDDELPGAELELYRVITDDGAETRVLIDNWVSESTAHIINIDSKTSTNNKLVAGGTYVMIEKRAPQGYQIAEEITFTIEKNGDVVGTTTMFDTEINQLGISKVDVLGEEVIGAHLQIFDSEGNLVEEWDSASTPHVVKLNEGIYTLKEETAPHGYLVTTEITFAVDANGRATVDGNDSNGLIKMTDDISTVSIVKVGKNGEEVSEIPGAKMKLTYTGDGSLDLVLAENGTITKDGNIITWTSGNTAVKLQRIPNGSYVLEETQAPEGYEIATQITFDVVDGKVININIDEESKSTYSNGIISMFDELKPTTSTTEDSTTTSTTTSTTKDTTTTSTTTSTTRDTTTTSTTTSTSTTKDTITTSTTTSTTKGTTTTSTTATTVSTAGPTNTTTSTTVTTASTAGPTNTTTTTTITSTTTSATTTSTSKTTRPTITITSDTSESVDTGDVLGSTTTTTTTTTTITTTTTTTTSSTTTVTTEKTQQVQIAKREIAGGYITGAEVIGAYLKVTADDATVIDSWVSDGTFHTISGLKEGVTYTLSESAPPTGYYYAASIQFTVLDGDVYIVNRDGSLNPVTDGTIIMYDEAIIETTVEPIVTTTVTTTTEYIDTDDSSETSETIYTTEETTTETVKYDIDISKQEIVNDAITGREVPGAMLQISTSEGIIEQWISGYEPHRIYGLLENVVYTLTEVQAPDDYALAESIDFVIYGGVVYVDGQPTGNTVVMYDRYAPVTATTTETTISSETTTTTTTTSTTEETTTTTSTVITDTTISTNGTGTTTRYTTTTTRNNASNGGGGKYVNVTGSPKTQDSMMSVAGMGGAAIVLAIVAGMIRRKKK